MANNVEETTLHPAAYIFRGEIWGDIGGDSARLTKEISRLQPLFSFVQNVELRGAVDPEPLSRLITVEEHNGSTVRVLPSAEHSTISTVQLSQGTIVDDGDGERLIIPIVSAPQLVLENIGGLGGLGLRMADKSLGVFPREMMRGETAVRIADDDTAILAVYVSKQYSIRGVLNGLENEYLIAFKEKHYDPSRLTSLLITTPFLRRGMLSMALSNGGEGVTFTPTSIVMDITPGLKETLHLIGVVASSRGNDLASEVKTPSDELLHLTIEALGNDDQKSLMKDHRRLKLQRDALMSIRKKALHADITHGDVSMSFSLDEGELINIRDDYHVWRIDLVGKENSCMVANDISSSILSLSGTRLNSDSIWTNLHHLLSHRHRIIYRGTRRWHSSHTPIHFRC